MLSVPLRFLAQESPVRRGEPVTVGLPWPRSAVTDDGQFRLIGPEGTERTLQTNVLDRWPDGSVRWCLFDFLATVDGVNDGYRIETARRVASPPAPANAGTERVRQLVGGIKLDRETGPVPLGNFHFAAASSGPVRNRIEFHTEPVDGLNVFGHIDSFLSNSVVRVSLTIRNSQPAEHPGGNWDLGNGGSIFIERFSISFVASEKAEGTNYRVSPERGVPVREVAIPLSIRQFASGGAHWRSANHLDRAREVPFIRNGYEVAIGDAPTTKGLRATPIVVANGVGIAVPYYWENFPVAIAANAAGIELELLGSGTELQGGEQKTFAFSVAFGPDAATDEVLVGCRSPLLCHADPEWYANSGAIPYLTPKAVDRNVAYNALVGQAIVGNDTFFDKREKIDEYGWRHFGDIYGDHEAVDWSGPEPMVSHYNNQYDCVAGFLYQFLRSGDRRWWDLAIPCADHTCDVDVYHTDRDKTAYTRALFWHTYHYAPADTGTHRSYPKSLRAGPQGSLTQKMDQLGATAAALKKSYAVGGGPAASHNYNRGLMLGYFFTGNPFYRDTAIDLAKFVIAMEDPSKTPFRWLSREFTGLATESGGGGYHGPGRAAANSIHALLVGYRLTGDRAFLEKAEHIIRRVAHPEQNLDRLDLLNAELRWFYTMFLQALGQYLDDKIELGELDRMYAYGRLTLLHYARWMATHERPILDTPEKLQYPTETWAAQDMRKVEVFQYAAKHSTGQDREAFLERAEWFFRYVETTLGAFPTKSLCRPVVLMLNFGWSRAWWQNHPDASAPEPGVRAESFGEWRMFVPQKAIAMQRAKRIAAAGLVGFALAVAAGIAWLLLR